MTTHTSKNIKYGYIEGFTKKCAEFPPKIFFFLLDSVSELYWKTHFVGVKFLVRVVLNIIKYTLFPMYPGYPTPPPGGQAD